jgi:PAS domain S-box-containing protein
MASGQGDEQIGAVERRSLEAVFDTADSFVGLLDPDGAVRRVNEAVRSFSGVDPKTFLGEPFWEGPWFDHDESLQERIEAAVATARSGETVEFDATHVSPEGRAIDVEGTIRPVRDEDGTVETLVAHGIDVTEQNRRLEAVQRNQARLGTILDNAPLALLVIEQDGTVSEARGAAFDVTDLEPDTAVGQSVFELYEGFPEITDSVSRALDGTAIEAELDFGGRNFQTYLEPVRDEGGDVQEVIAVAQNVTELKTREQELQAWKDRLQTVIENAPMVVFSYDPDGTVTMSQGKGLSAYGLEPGELVGQNLYEAYADDPDLQRDVKRAAEGEDVTSIQELDDVVFKIWFRPIERDGEVERVIGVTIDITQQKRQERRIEAMSDATNDLIDARSPAAVGRTVMDIAGDVLDEPLSGIWTCDEDAEVLEPLAATDSVLDAMDATDATDALPTIGPGTTEMSVLEDGSVRVVDDYAALDDPAQQDAPLGTVAMVPLGEFGMLHVGSSVVEPFSDADLNLVRILAGNAEAALERAEREQELATHRQELERSNESLQQFAYIASHDLQEPLRMVSSYVDLLETEYGEELDGEAREYMDFAVDGAERMQAMIEALLAYSRVQTQGEEFTRTDTAAVVDETRRDLSLRIEETGAEVRASHLPTVEADRTQLGQLFQNLIENAIDHAGDGMPTVEITAQEGDESIEFAVADDGVGIPEADQERIFEIFKSGHRGSEVPGGTGIGLAVCERIVHRHGGDIWVDSAPGDGATFRFTIPKTTETTLP